MAIQFQPSVAGVNLARIFAETLVLATEAQEPKVNTEQSKRDLYLASEHFLKIAGVFSSLKNSDLTKDQAVVAEVESLANAMAKLLENLGSLKELSRKTNSNQVRTRPVLRLVKR
ncbi:hypothetical protein [Pseudomonas antarctica]|uniref:hypothetical protein n=1 Tax=Pseudomonas antarctica TaxID=219572 RepID=UPI003F74E6D7